MVLGPGCDRFESVRRRTGSDRLLDVPASPIILHMAVFAVVAGRSTPTNERLGSVLGPAQAVARLRDGDVALGRLDVLFSLDGIEPGLWALEVLERRGVEPRP